MRRTLYGPDHVCRIYQHTVAAATLDTKTAPALFDASADFDTICVFRCSADTRCDGKNTFRMLVYLKQYTLSALSEVS
jgi:hypothetical protein